MNLKLIQIAFLSLILTISRVSANIEPPSFDDVRNAPMHGVRATEGFFENQITHYEGTIRTPQGIWTLTTHRTPPEIISQISRSGLGVRQYNDCTSTLSLLYWIGPIHDIIASMTVSGLYTVSPDKNTWILDTETTETCGCF